MKKTLRMLLVLTMVVMMLAGCAVPAATAPAAAAPAEKPAAEAPAEAAKEPATAPAASEEPLKFAIFIANNANEFTMSVGNGAVNRGKELGIEVTVFDAKYDLGTQLNQIETCMTTGYKGLIIEPCATNGYADVIKEAKEMGIAVCTVIQDLEKSEQDECFAFVGADHHLAAILQAETAFAAVGNKGNVGIITGAVGGSGEIAITTGYEEVLAKNPDMKVVEKQDGEWVIDKALEIAETWMLKYQAGEINVILGESDALAMGAVQACIDAGVTGINISGRDCTSDAMYAIKDGTLSFTIYQDGPGMGGNGVDAVVDCLNGGNAWGYLLMDNIVVDSSNVDEYLKKLGFEG